MSIEQLENRRYQGELSTARSAVAAFVAATGDDPHRWHDHAPPAFAAAALFAVAPAFLWDPGLGDYSNVLIHAGQRFIWHLPWDVDANYDVAAFVGRVRMRSGTAWASFLTEVKSPDGRLALSSESTFLMSQDRPEAPAGERAEPEPYAKGEDAAAVKLDGEKIEPVYRSASRADLIRYAAASGDFNPLHWDHDTAVASGLSGVACHGLLMASWLSQVAAALSERDRPLAEARFRFRSPLPAGDQAVISGDVEDRVRLTLTSGGSELVSATIGLAP